MLNEENLSLKMKFIALFCLYLTATFFAVYLLATARLKMMNVDSLLESEVEIPTNLTVLPRSLQKICFKNA